MADALEPGLTLVATPIGNARDITLRALDAFRNADVLIAEDTRSLLRLMEIHGIPLQGRPLWSFHDHSSARDRDRILAALADGLKVVYASEAGTPLIADPGYSIVRAARDADMPVTSAPGPSAIVSALSISGLPTDRFFFAGFLPSKQAARKRGLQDLQTVPGTLVFYESPKRLAKSLADMAAVLGAERPARICRELTKRFEQVVEGTLGDLAKRIDEAPVKGEVVVLVGSAERTAVSDVEIRETLERALARESLKDAVAEVTDALGLPRRKVYQLALEILGKS